MRPGDTDLRFVTGTPLPSPCRPVPVDGVLTTLTASAHDTVPPRTSIGQAKTATGFVSTITPVIGDRGRGDRRRAGPCVVRVPDGLRPDAPRAVDAPGEPPAVAAYMHEYFLPWKRCGCNPRRDRDDAARLSPFMGSPPPVRPGCGGRRWLWSPTRRERALPARLSRLRGCHRGPVAPLALG